MELFPSFSHRGDWENKNCGSSLTHDNIEELCVGDQAAAAGHAAASAVGPDGGGARPHHKNPGSRGQRGHTAAAPWRRRRTEEAMEEAPLSVHTEAALVWTLSVAAAPAWCPPRPLATGRREIIFEFVLVTSPRLAAVSPSAARRPGEQEREK